MILASTVAYRSHLPCQRREGVLMPSSRSSQVPRAAVGATRTLAIRIELYMYFAYTAPVIVDGRLIDRRREEEMRVRLRGSRVPDGTISTRPPQAKASAPSGGRYRPRHALQNLAARDFARWLWPRTRPGLRTNGPCPPAIIRARVRADSSRPPDRSPLSGEGMRQPRPP